MQRSSPAPVAGASTILLSVCLAALIMPLNFSAGAVAALAIGREFGGDAGLLSWITSAFMLTFGSSLMVAGTLADQFGRKRLFLSGVAALTVLSLALCAAESLAVLSALRALEGFAAAAALAGGGASLAQVFHGRALARAFSALGTSFGVGLAFGPLVAGLLIQTFGWRSIFLAIAGVGMVAFIFGVSRMRESRDPHPSGVDWAGAVTFTAALACFTFALLEAPAYGWTGLRVPLLLAASLVFGVLFVRIERRVAHPMLDLSLFRYPRFIGVQALPIGTCYCFVVLLVLLPLRFIGIDGLDERAAGVLMLALSAPMLVVPTIATWLTRWVAPGLLVTAGFLIAAMGLCLMSQVADGSDAHALFPWMVLIGCGTGVPWGLMDGLAMTVVPPDRAGMASGIFNTTRVAGEGIALAIVSAVLALLVQAGVAGHAGATVGTVNVRAVARQVAAGDLSGAERLLSSASRAMLIADYAGAFRVLLLLLCALTVVAAVVTLFCLLPRQGRGVEKALVES
jgi:MFS family permease